MAPRPATKLLHGALFDLKRLDALAAGTSPLHRLDPRATVLATLAFILAVVSHDRYQLAGLVPYALFPAAMIRLAGLPAGYIARKVALLCPFALMVAIGNPLFDRETLLHVGPLAVSGGWVSCLSIVLRSALTVTAALVLVAITGFPAICRALARLGVPQPFVVQLLFLYRYLFLLSDEGGRAARARELRSCGHRGQGIRSYGGLLGGLLVRTWQRAERIHTAMLARGFTGTFPAGGEGRFGARETAFLLGWSLLFVLLRLAEGRLPGGWMTGGTP